jgi:hypothetical protein
MEKENKMKKIVLSTSLLLVIGVNNLYAKENLNKSLITVVNDLNKRMDVTEKYLYYTDNLVTKKDFKKNKLSLELLESKVITQSEKMKVILDMLHSEKLMKIMKTIDSDFGFNIKQTLTDIEYKLNLSLVDIDNLKKTDIKSKFEIQNISDRINQIDKDLKNMNKSIDLNIKNIGILESKKKTLEKLEVIVKELMNNKNVLNKIDEQSLNNIKTNELKEKTLLNENKIKQLEKQIKNGIDQEKFKKLNNDILKLKEEAVNNNSKDTNKLKKKIITLEKITKTMLNIFQKNKDLFRYKLINNIEEYILREEIKKGRSLTKTEKEEIRKKNINNSLINKENEETIKLFGKRINKFKKDNETVMKKELENKILKQKKLIDKQDKRINKLEEQIKLLLKK